MEKKNKIIIAIIGVILAIFLVIGGIILVHDATTVTVDDLKQEEALYNEAVENGSINNTTEKDEIEAKRNSFSDVMDSSDERVSNALNT